MKRLAIAISLLLPVVPAMAAPQLQDGIYGCTISNMFLGEIEISGGTYRGPAFDGKWEGSYSFEVTEQGTITWGGPLGGISAAGKVVSTVLGKAFGDSIGFDITIQNDRGNFQTISCLPN